MKYLFYLSIFFISTNSFGQSLTQQEFDKINDQIRELIFSATFKKEILFEKMNIDYDVNFTDEINHIILDYKKNIMFPFYQESKKENKLLLTVYYFTDITKESENDLSKLGKAEYHFIIECEVSLKNDHLIFENQILITEKSDILKWFLKTYKDYLNTTRPINKSYGYIPPPPPPIPDNLEYSPYHLGTMLNRYLDDEDWVNAKIMINKLIYLYPYDPLSYYKRGFIKLQTNRLLEGCEDLKKSSDLGLSQKYPHHIERFNKLKRNCEI
jgi:hypothetical protein